MGLFGFGRRRDVIDLGERYKKQQARIKEMQSDSDSNVSSSDSSSSGLGGFGVFSSMASANSSSSDSSDSGSYVDVSLQTDDKKRKLAKRLMDMTDKMEDLNNQIYHLQQRIEVLERRAGTGRL